jgi:hypothetical protein
VGGAGEVGWSASSFCRSAASPFRHRPRRGSQVAVVHPLYRRSLRCRREAGAGCTGVPGSRSSSSRAASTTSSSGLMATVCDRWCSSSSRLRRASRKTEDGDFPAAEKLLFVKAAPAREERGGSGGSARLCPAAAMAKCWVLRDLVVLSVSFEGCTAGLCPY